MTLEEMYDTNGYRLEDIMGEKYYVTKDEKGRSTIGPRRRGGRGMLSWGRRAHRSTRKPAQEVAEATIVIPQYGSVAVGVAPAYVRDAGEGRLSRLLKDRQWHRAVQHTAVDVAMWASCLALSAVVLKVAYWVVTL